jgi:hypothetical protein
LSGSIPLPSRLVPYREAQLLLDQARTALEGVIALSPQNLTLHASVPAREVWVRFRGLAVAKWEDGRVSFGAADSQEELAEGSRPRLQRWIKELESYRQPLATDTRRPLYRAQAERWLEAIIAQDLTAIDAALDSRFAYWQVFAKSGGEQGILDVLGVTRSGRRAIVELKANEHIHLPLQAAAYWLRIRQHLVQGDFPRLGYFPGVTLQSRAPLVYLVALRCVFIPQRTRYCAT